MDIRRLLFGFGLLCTGAVSAGTVMQPIDGDVNFFVNDPFPYTLAVFDNDSFGVGNGSGVNAGLEVILSGPVLGLLGGTINFSNESPAGSGNYTATNSAPEVISLTGGNLFMVGLWDGSAWLMDTATTQLPANGAQLEFNVGGSVLAVDVAVIPIPASVWLFGSGLLGLVGIARRKKVA